VRRPVRSGRDRSPEVGCGLLAGPWLGRRRAAPLGKLAVRRLW